MLDYTPLGFDLSKREMFNKISEKLGRTGRYAADKAMIVITKACLYNFDSLKPHFYILKLELGVYIIFLISAQYIDCVYSLELPHRGGSNEYPQSMFFFVNFHYI